MKQLSISSRKCQLPPPPPPPPPLHLFTAAVTVSWYYRCPKCLTNILQKVCQVGNQNVNVCNKKKNVCNWILKSENRARKSCRCVLDSHNNGPYPTVALIQKGKWNRGCHRGISCGLTPLSLAVIPACLLSLSLGATLEPSVGKHRAYPDL